MKTSKKQLSFLGCLAILSLMFVACDPGNDDTKVLTPAEKQQAYLEVKGNYAGDFIYPAKNEKNPKDNSDTLKIKWDIMTDSTVIIKDFPLSVFANYVKDKDLKEALKKAPNKDLKCLTNYYRLAPAGFLLDPVKQEFTLKIGGKDHKITVYFYIRNRFSFGLVVKKPNVRMQIVAGAIQMDAAQNNYLQVPVALVFDGAPLPSSTPKGK